MTPRTPLRLLTFVALIALLAPSLNSRPAQATEDNISGSYSSLVDLTAGGIIGKGVYNPDGAKLGEISDLVIRKADKVSYAVISTGDRHGKEIVVPYQALKLSPETIKIVLELNLDDIQVMREYKRDDFTSIRAPSKG